MEICGKYADLSCVMILFGPSIIKPDRDILLRFIAFTTAHTQSYSAIFKTEIMKILIAIAIIFAVSNRSVESCFGSGASSRQSDSDINGNINFKK